MRWACLLLPHLALDGLLRRMPDATVPTVLIDGPTQRRVLRDVSDRAHALGLRPGQSLPTAQALVGNLCALPHDPRLQFAGGTVRSTRAGGGSRRQPGTVRPMAGHAGALA